MPEAMRFGTAGQAGRLRRDGHGVSIGCRFMSLVLVNAPGFGGARA
jgi:hypothetical protein